MRTRPPQLSIHDSDIQNHQPECVIDHLALEYLGVSVVGSPSLEMFDNRSVTSTPLAGPG